MAKKGQTKKKVETAEVLVSESVPAEIVDVSLCESSDIGGELIVDENIITECKITTIKCKPIEKMCIEELMWAEKACALICKKYETTARIDFEGNKKLTEFSSYYNEIIHELEKRIISVCNVS